MCISVLAMDKRSMHNIARSRRTTIRWGAGAMSVAATRHPFGHFLLVRKDTIDVGYIGMLFETLLVGGQHPATLQEHLPGQQNCFPNKPGRHLGARSRAPGRAKHVRFLTSRDRSLNCKAKLLSRRLSSQCSRSIAEPFSDGLVGSGSSPAITCAIKHVVRREV